MVEKLGTRCNGGLLRRVASQVPCRVGGAAEEGERCGGWMPQRQAGGQDYEVLGSFVGGDVSFIYAWRRIISTCRMNVER